MIAACGLVAIGSAPTRADPTTCGGSATVSVEVAGASHIYTVAQLCAAADVFNTTYQTRGIPGQANTQSTPQVQQGTSIRALLGLIGVDPDTVQFIDVPRTDGTWTTLSTEDLADPSDFADGLQPVFVVNGDHIDYYRPLYPSSSDTNAADHVQSPDGGDLAVGVHTGPLLSVTATASPSKVTTGSKATFTAAVTGGAASSTPYRYVWAFGDGTSGTGRSAKHAFAQTGSFDAQVTVTGADTSGGVSPAVQVTVGTPPTSGEGPGSGTHHQPHHPPNGPTHSHGHIAGSTPAPRDGAGHSAAGSSNTAPAISLPPPSAKVGTGHVIKRREARTTTPVLADPPPTVTGRVVSPGIVLSAQQTANAAKPTSPPARLGGSRAAIGGGVAIGCGVVALICIGMARELRATRHRSAGSL